MLGDLDGLHAGAETHGGVGLGYTTSDTTDDATTELAGTGAASIVFGFGGDEEEDGALGGSFNPSPRDKTLVNYENLKSAFADHELFCIFSLSATFESLSLQDPGGFSLRELQKLQERKITAC